MNPNVSMPDLTTGSSAVSMQQSLSPEVFRTNIYNNNNYGNYNN